jgi:dihydroxy-acid dehydratase
MRTKKKAIKSHMNELNTYSKTVTQDPTQPAAQAMLHAIGLTTEDFF